MFEPIGSEEVRQGKWLRRKVIKDEPRLAFFAHDLGRGEIEAILLAGELKAVLIVDDRKARQEAEKRGIATIGSLKVIKEAKDKGFIDKVRPLADRLRKEGLWIKEELYHEFLKEIGEG